MKDQGFHRQLLPRPPTSVSMQLWTFLLGTSVLGVERVGRMGSRLHALDGPPILSSGLCILGGQEAPRTSNWRWSGTLTPRSGESSRAHLKQGRQSLFVHNGPSCASSPDATVGCMKLPGCTVTHSSKKLQWQLSVYKQQQ